MGSARLARLGGRLDGAIERGLLFTVPLSAGFAAVEVLFDHLASGRRRAGDGTYRLIHGSAIAAMALGYGALSAGRRLASRHLGHPDPRSLAANAPAEEGPVGAGVDVVD